MKKIITGILLCAMAFALLAGCNTAAVIDETDTIRIGGLKGPTSMGMVNMMDNEAYEFTIAGAVDEVTGKIVKGDIDIAAVPANLASVLYNNTDGAIVPLAINTLGVIYILENGDAITSLEDLRGKTVYSSGKGATPEYALNFILEQNGIDPVNDLTIEYKSEHTEVVAALAQTPGAIGVLPQPFVAIAQTSIENLRIVIDLDEEWNKLDTASGMITGALVVNREFAEKNPNLIKTFIEEYKASVDFTNENIDEAAALIGQYEIVPEPIAKKAIPYSNIVCITGDEMETLLNGYLDVLFAANPAAVGGSVPDADVFYYEGK